MTATDPYEIRQEIEQTRAELSNDVNALTYKVQPESASARCFRRLGRCVAG
jgi:hypothetical protein